MMCCWFQVPISQTQQAGYEKHTVLHAVASQTDDKPARWCMDQHNAGCIDQGKDAADWCYPSPQRQQWRTQNLSCGNSVGYR